MTFELPNSIVIRSKLCGKYLRHLRKPEEEKGFVTDREPYVFNPLCKIAVERAKSDERYVNLRFIHSNKYWAQEPGGSRLCATSDEAEEDTSKESCTLFEAVTESGKRSFKHVRTGCILTSPSWSDGEEHVFLGMGWGPQESSSFEVIDSETIVMLPTHVGLKGDNGHFLRDFWEDGHPYLQFSASDCSDTTATGHRVSMVCDGNVRIISNSTGKFWRRGPDRWIQPDASDTGSNDNDILFRPLKLSDTAIALASQGSGHFCSRFTIYYDSVRFISCLYSECKEVDQYATLQVEELVLERQITDVRYHTEDARIYDEQQTVTQSHPFPSPPNIIVDLTVEYKHINIYSFTNSSSLRTGVKTTVSADFPIINKEGKIEIILSPKDHPLEWNKTIDKSALQVETCSVHLLNIRVPCEVSLEYISTAARYDVPFSYTQIDKLSHDGRLVTTQHHDGIFTGHISYKGHTKPNIIYGVLPPHVRAFD